MLVDESLVDEDGGARRSVRRSSLDEEVKIAANEKSYVKQCR